MSYGTNSVISARNLSKAYRVYAKPYHRALELLLPGVRRHRECWALRNVTLEIPQLGLKVPFHGEIKLE